MSSFSVPPLVSGINFDISGFTSGISQMGQEVHSVEPIIGGLESHLKDSVEHGVAGAGAALQLFPPLLVEFIENPAAGAVAAVMEGFNKLKEAVMDVGNRFEQVNLGSLKSGLDPETFSTFSSAAKASGVEIATFTNGLDLMLDKAQNALRGDEAAAKGFEDLGISATKLKELVNEPKEMLLAVADAMAAIPTQAGRVQAAMESMGKGGKDMLPFLQQGSQGIEELAQKMGDAGARVTGDQAKMGAAFAQTQEQVSVMWDKVKEETVQPFLQGLIDHADELEEVIQSVGDVMSNVMEVVGPPLKIIAGILKTVVDSFVILNSLGGALTHLLFGDMEGASKDMGRVEAASHRVLRDIGVEQRPQVHVETHVTLNADDVANKTADLNKRQIDKGWEQYKKEMDSEQKKDKVQKATRGSR